MGSRLVLKHGRTGETYTGKIIRTVESDTMVPEMNDLLEVFKEIPFSRMMSRFSHFAIENPEATLLVERTERPDLVPIELDAPTADLLRRDPAACIRSMSPPNRTTLSLETKVRTQDEVSSRVRAGYDTLADSFGEDIYCKLRFAGDGVFEVESPFTGKWVGLGVTTEGQILAKTGRQTAHVDWLPIELVPMGSRENPRWAVVKTETLLHHRINPPARPAVPRPLPERFFVPRRWNKTSPWITREELQNMYDSYKEEKENVR